MEEKTENTPEKKIEEETNEKIEKKEESEEKIPKAPISQEKDIDEIKNNQDVSQVRSYLNKK